jgi:hypothetical protein
MAQPWIPDAPHARRPLIDPSRWPDMEDLALRGWVLLAALLLFFVLLVAAPIPLYFPVR